ncbi:MAG: NAD-dependent epimerase/dehydratase family protein [Candidatus Omnitrophota bacterium]|jgi:dTDP-glucose 4,6-dehydratase
MIRSAVKGKNIFITGGSGFIGSWLIERLIRDNKIWCYDNGRRFSPKVKELIKHKNMTFIKGDILDVKLLRKSFPKKIDIVIHLAAIAGVSSYYKIPYETMKVNLIGTYNLLEIIKDRKLDVFIDFSTSEVYGRNARNVTEEDDTALGPISDLRWTYSTSKIAAERLTHCYHRKFGIPAVSIRPFNVYGPFQIGEGAIQIFAQKALKNDTIVIHGDGSQVRAWCYIEDFLDGVMRCITKRKKAIGNTFNIGDPSGALTIKDLAQRIVRVSGSSSKLRFVKQPRTDVDFRIPDISKAKRLLGFKPSMDITEGLRRSVEWYKENPF